MTCNLVINPWPDAPVDAHPVEICEHKGEGHPDTLCDSVCEAASRALSKAYLARYGAVLHHNLDKGLLVAGRSRPQFGGGTLEAPIKLILCGRASALGNMDAAVRIALDAGQQQLASFFPMHPEAFRLQAELHAGSGDLKQVFAGHGVPVANDTSYGTGYAPFSRLEATVLQAAGILRAPDFRQQFPVAGRDYKIMGLCQDNAIHLIIALAFIDRFVEDAAHYFRHKQAVHHYLARRLPGVAGIRINTLDHPAARSERDLYLTVTGLSCEMGDDGEVGRGNRVNGLITPSRPMSLEAVAGKNPVSHTGKLYNVMAHLIAQSVYETLAEVEAVAVTLLSAIGQPVDQPQLASIAIRVAGRITPGMRAQIRAIAGNWLANGQQVTRMILAGALDLH